MLVKTDTIARREGNMSFALWPYRSRLRSHSGPDALFRSHFWLEQ